MTYSINSLCHFFGRRRFDTDDESRNLLWLAPLSMGESWHNNHHAFPTSAQHGLRPWEIDLSAMVIRALEAVGLAWDVQRVPRERQLAKAGAGAAELFGPARTQDRSLVGSGTPLMLHSSLPGGRHRRVGLRVAPLHAHENHGRAGRGELHERRDHQRAVGARREHTGPANADPSANEPTLSPAAVVKTWPSKSGGT